MLMYDIRHCINTMNTVTMNTVTIKDYKTRLVNDYRVFTFTANIKGDDRDMEFGVVVNKDVGRIPALQRVIDRIKSDFNPGTVTIKICTRTLASPVNNVSCEIIDIGKKYVKTTYECTCGKDTFTINTPCGVDISLEEWKKVIPAINSYEMKNIHMRYLIENPSHGFEEVVGAEFC